jgi:hypothetical protein
MNRRIYLIRGIHGAISVAILISCVLALYRLFHLPSLVAIPVGAAFSLLLSTTIRRRFLPEVPPWADEELAALPNLRLVWLPVGIAMIVLIYFGTHLPLAIAVGIVVVIIGAFVGAELRARRDAVRRLSLRPKS